MSYRYPPAQSAEATSTKPSAACILTTATIRRGEGGPMLGPTGAVASHACWVTGIKLSAVQPACLRAHQTFSMISSTSEHMAAEVASQQEYHSLQLHLQVMLDSQLSSPLETSQDATPYGLVVGPSSLPMLLEHAVLELAVLTQHSQILNQQHSLLQLLQEQSQQTSQPEPLEAAADLVPATTDLSSCWPMHLRVNVSCPPQHSEQPLSCLHLVVTVRTAEQPTQLQAAQQLLDEVQHSQQLEQGHSTEAGWTDAHQAARPAVGLIAEVPLLVLPAVAQQEVQQLLLPAMRQEVQAEQQQQQQHPELQQLSQTGSLPTANTASTSSEWAIEHRVWQHYQQLVNDIHTVMLLVDMLQSPAAEAAATSIAADAAAAAVAAAAAQQHATAAGGFEAAGVSEALRLDATDVAAGQAAAGAAAAPIGLSSAVALNSIADNLLFPVLLPFLAAHGLHNLLQLVVEYLPQQLQQQWEQQQLERLMVDEEIPATAAAAVDPGIAVAGSVHTTAGREGGSCAADASVATQQQQQQQRQLEGDDPDSAAKPQQQQQESSASSKQAQQQHQQDPKLLDHLCKDDDSNDEDLKGSSKPAAASAASSIAAEAGQQLQPAVTGAAGPAPAVYWYTPLLQFNRAEESRYLTWKHYTLIHLDYIGALFAVMYLLALLKRMISEPTTLFYFIYVLLKCMPLAPLILGFRQPFLRYRELWLWLVIPASLLTFLWFMKVQKVGSPISLLPQKALSAYWNGRGEIMTSAMRPFIQHMRLRPYVAYTLADAAMVAWVFAQFYGWWAALGRWGFAASLSIGLCWGLDLHMRRRFAALRRT